MRKYMTLSPEKIKEVAEEVNDVDELKRLLHVIADEIEKYESTISNDPSYAVANEIKAIRKELQKQNRWDNHYGNVSNYLCQEPECYCRPYVRLCKEHFEERMKKFFEEHTRDKSIYEIYKRLRELEDKE